MLASFLDDLGLCFVVFVAVMFGGMYALKKSFAAVPWGEVARHGIDLTRFVFLRR